MSFLSMFQSPFNRSASPLVASPIQRLDFDVLWRIFNMNADIFDDQRALKTTLATSYVCQAWRSFLLSSPSIWAHIIALDHSLWSTVGGTDEMIRRCGTALMWMKTNEVYLPLHRLKAAMNIIDVNWERIERLEVKFLAGPMDHWTPLYRPALHLKSFAVYLNQEYHNFNNILPSLFSGRAPMLRDLHLEGNRHDFPRMSWLKQLRSVELSKMTVSQALKVLQSTPKVTNLRLADIVSDDHTDVMHTLVSLPQLAHLYLDVQGLSTAAALLEHIYIPPSCTVSFLVSLTKRGEIKKKSISGPVIRALSTHAGLYFAHHALRHLELLFTNNKFLFKLRTTVHCDEPGFTFSLRSDLSEVFPAYLLNMLLSEFALPGLSTVTSFTISIGTVDNPIPTLTSFMACLPSVTTVTTDRPSLRHLRAHSTHNEETAESRKAFPALNVLEITPVSYRCISSKFDNTPDPVSKFANSRISLGDAIDVIEFQKATSRPGGPPGQSNSERV